MRQVDYHEDETVPTIRTHPKLLSSVQQQFPNGYKLAHTSRNYGHVLVYKQLLPAEYLEHKHHVTAPIIQRNFTVRERSRQAWAELSSTGEPNSTRFQSLPRLFVLRKFIDPIENIYTTPGFLFNKYID